MSILKVLIPAFLLFAGASAHAEAPTTAALFEIYDEIHDALAADRVAGVAEAASRMAALADSADEGTDVYVEVAQLAKQLKGKELSPLRSSFAELSRAMARLATSTSFTGAQLYHCPMEKAYWFQPTTDMGVANPYLGSSMSKCGSRVDVID
jgi:hypothetical protein